MQRYVLVGNYGVGNLGDEALKEYFLDHFSAVTWIVVSAHPKGRQEVPRLPSGFRSILSPWWRTVAAIRRCDGIVYGGGTLFTDAESIRACFIWWPYALFAACFGKKIILAFQGIGPCEWRVNRWIVQWLTKRAVSLSVRDEISRERVYEWMGEESTKNKKIVQSFDPIFSSLVQYKSDERTSKLIIIPRSNSSPEFYEIASETSHCQQWQKVMLLSLDPTNDAMAIERLRSTLEESACVESKDIHSLAALASEVAGASLVLTQRYHGAVAALALGIPFRTVPLRSGDKLAAISSMSAQQCTLLVERGRVTLGEALH